eukprot:1192367-Prorocentrum_minimum.AAC.1
MESLSRSLSRRIKEFIEARRGLSERVPLHATGQVSVAREGPTERAGPRDVEELPVASRKGTAQARAHRGVARDADSVQQEDALLAGGADRGAAPPAPQIALQRAVEHGQRRGGRRLFRRARVHRLHPDAPAHPRHVPRQAHPLQGQLPKTQRKRETERSGSLSRLNCWRVGRLVTH